VKQIVYFSIILVCIACNPMLPTQESAQKTYIEIGKTNWLIGKWQTTWEVGVAYETWQKETDSSLAGISYGISGKDTVAFESVKLKQIGTALLYIPTVKEQNNGMPVSFTLTSSGNNYLVFENLKHDYPQKISYQQISVDSMVAEISGVMNGKNALQTFPFTRAKSNGK
jgi:hypothetical protein